jgi:hypothetical protein
MIGDSNEVTNFEILLLEPKISAYLNKVLERIRENIVEFVEMVIEDTLDYYNDNLKKNTGYQLTDAEVRRLKSDTFRQFATHDFQGLTFDSRIERIRKRVLILIGEQLRFAVSNKNSGKELAKDLALRFFSSEPSNNITVFGSCDTLLVAEENRVYQETALALFNYIGVRCVRFCLTPEHKDKDICDTFASFVDITIEQVANEKGLDPEGIYRIADFPDSPHPRALLYIEPIYELGFSPFDKRG